MFVLGVVVLATALSPAHDALALIQQLAQSTVWVFSGMILCGASPYEHQWHTFWASLYLATLTASDPPIFQKSACLRIAHLEEKKNKNPSPFAPFLAMPSSSSSTTTSRSKQDRLASVVGQATLAAVIPMQILLLYDRGWQVQRWPVPVILGSSYGWALGVFLATSWQYLSESWSEKQQQRQQQQRRRVAASSGGRND
jgi:GPI biosynthesis protein family Pig-F